MKSLLRSGLAGSSLFNGYYPAIISIIAAGFFIRILQIGTDSLWIDEAFTGFIALTSEWLTYVQGDNTPPLYYFLQRGWCSLVTCDESGLRLSSVIAGVVFIAIIGVFCHQQFNRTVALLMIVFVSVSPLHVYYSQEARVYSLLLTMLLLYLYLQWQVLDRRASPVKLVLLFCVCTCVLFLHYFSIILVGVCLFVYIYEAWFRVRQVPRGYFLAIVGALLVYLPWFITSLLGERSTSTELGWIADYLQDKSLWLLPFRSIMTFLVGPQLYYDESNLFVKRYSWFEVSPVMHLVYFTLTSMFLVLLANCCVRLKYQSVQARLFFLESVAFVIIPLLALLFVTWVIRPVYVIGRYDLIVYPTFLMLLASMLSIALNQSQGNSNRMVTVVAVGMLLFSSLLFCKVMAYQLSRPYQDVEADVTSLLEKIGDRDGLLVASPKAVQFWYYLHKAGFDRQGRFCIGPDKQFSCRLFPENFEEAPALQTRYLAVYQRTDEASFNIDYVIKDLEPAARLILIVDRLDTVGGELQLDPVGYMMLGNLVRAGYHADKVYADNSLISFIRITE